MDADGVKDFEEVDVHVLNVVTVLDRDAVTLELKLTVGVIDEVIVFDRLAEADCVPVLELLALNEGVELPVHVGVDELAGVGESETGIPTQNPVSASG